ncbi:MAG: 2-amino-4-hydroxy-6-hydroxymethyldihydropteridine diphosphokinase, partial [Planctomycetia bacterium]|nr:2-amino-4-hydroxy-6-hydroxymethyldihydropteridine diphosphokinase [Planctomycetia bacterium]
ICLDIELGMGRERNELWGPRTIDIDILTFGEFHMEDEFLKIPHPRLSERRFVLGPWADLEPDFNIPVWGKTVQELLNALPSSLEGSPG